MNEFISAFILNAATETTMPIIVYRKPLDALAIFDGSPFAVRYKKPAYRPIATDTIETNHENQLMRLMNVRTIGFVSIECLKS